MSTKIEEVLTRIEKDRYLISCKCNICNKTFKDLIIGTQHVYMDHPKRENRNVIDNLSWDLQDDLKQWKILQKLKLKRDLIISKLTDENAIKKAEIPEVFEIVRRKVSLSDLIKTLEEELATKEVKSKKAEDEEVAEEEDEEIDERDFEDSDDEEPEEENASNGDIEDEDLAEDEEEDLEDEEEEEEEDEEASSKKAKTQDKVEIINDKAEIPKLIELLEREVDKYLRSIKRVSMADDVKRAVEAKKKKPPNLYKLADQIDYYLGVSKTVQLLKDSL